MWDELFGWFTEDDILSSSKFWIVSIIGAVTITIVYIMWGTGSFLGGGQGKGFSLGVDTMIFSYILVLVVAYILAMRDMERNG